MKLHLLSGLFLASARLTAQVPAGADYIARNFKFESGQTLAEVRMHYIALGKPRRDAAGVVRNAILVIHAGGGGHGFARLGRDDVAHVSALGRVTPLQNARD